MTSLVVAAVLAAAIVHASWNALLHTIGDRLAAMTLITGGSAAMGVVLAFFVPFPPPAALPYLLASAVLHIGYQWLLTKSFSLGDFGQMYPVARGTAPLVVSAVAALFIGESLNGPQFAGVAVVSLGLAGVALWGLRGTGTRPDWPALGAAGATGLAIAAYTVVDGLGVRESGSPLGFLAWLLILQGVPIAGYAWYRLRSGLLPALRPYAARGLVGAAMAVAGYGLVLWAQTRAPLAPVAALRESSIVVGAVIGALFFGERFGVPRVAAAGVMAVGIGLLLGAG
ncbi:DMT family transporter [Streptomyces yaizuensis]|uniref:DMT family transporter n=1 Tax=Streptomyces yaizuensis TaxID=2989713 RepID=A0ABQ5NRF6_9ACTN|nr:DMT family transporter [Streptomyces sp. YSPA8]GLF92750.1 DMT family transporter [Streptomyces sp. YSPA8]